MDAALGAAAAGLWSNFCIRHNIMMTENGLACGEREISVPSRDTVEEAHGCAACIREHLVALAPACAEGPAAFRGNGTVVEARVNLARCCVEVCDERWGPVDSVYYY